MSDFSFPASEAREQADRYMDGLLGVVGDRDPLEVQAQQPAALREAVAGMSDEALRTPEAPGKWSVLDVLFHLADTELVHRYRMRKIVAEPGCELAGYDQDAWADGLRYGDADAADVLAEYDALRAANLRWLRQLTDEELDREGIHAERGPESVRRVVCLLAGHDLVHLEQIERIKGAVL